IYTVVFITPPGLTPHSAHDHLSHHDDTCETDPCHIAIFHPGHTGACSHKYHLTQGHSDCPKCKLSILKQVPATAYLFSFHANTKTTTCLVDILTLIRECSFSATSRGPPGSSHA
ncbi:MAG: hypothetical protein M3R25_03340, partial [Bacteroidota bacterium]|nr:hypothetical protein [Bacteroidota bacterium]